MTRKNQNGFSLVELAIVLVVIGLLISGISAGDKLIASAKLRNSITQIDEIQTAIRVFKTTYKALPGDMDNASDYWSDASDGDGDFKLDSSEINDDWYDHLEYAELLEGYDEDSSGRPLAKFAKMGIELADDARWSEYPSKLLLRLRDYAGSGTVKATGAQALYLDTKMDDTRPYTGSVTATTDDDSNTCSATGSSSSGTCCADDLSMDNSSFDKAAAGFTGAVYLPLSERCEYIFIEVDL